VHHPTRLAIMVHLVRQGGRDRFQSVHKMLGGVGSPQTVMQHSRHLERAGVVTVHGLARAALAQSANILMCMPTEQRQRMIENLKSKVGYRMADRVLVWPLDKDFEQVWRDAMSGAHQVLIETLEEMAKMDPEALANQPEGSTPDPASPETSRSRR
jgi:hypothetical protein